MENKDVYLCPDCGEVGRPIYRMIFLVKDDSTMGADRVYKVHFYSYDGCAEQFFKGVKPTNFYRDTKSLEKIKTYINLLSRFNIYLDVIIRRKYSQRLNEDLFELYDGNLFDLSKINI